MLSRQRDILPLPPFEADLFDGTSKLSRSVKRRVKHQTHSVSWANDACRSLNDLGGRNLDPPSNGACEFGTRAAVSHVAEAFANIGEPPADLSQEGALRELLLNTSVYANSRADVQPFAKDRVS